MVEEINRDVFDAQVREEIQQEDRRRPLEELKRLVKIRVDDMRMDDPARVLQSIEDDNDLTIQDKQNVLLLAQTRIEVNSRRASFSSQTDLASVVEDYADRHPFFYNTDKVWWMWGEADKKWIMSDETDITSIVYNETNDSSIFKSSQKSMFLNAFRYVGRLKQPEKTPKNWIQFKDCYIDLKNPDEYHEVDKSYFFMNPIPWNVKDAPDGCPTIDRLFTEWVGEAEKQKLYEICAYCMLRDYPINRIFCLVGGGRNGKGKFMALLRKFLGQTNVTSTDLESLVNVRFESSKLFGRLLCQMGETDTIALEKTNIIKSAIGGDLIRGEFKGVSSFDFENYCKIIIATNSLPQTPDKTVGFYSKWIIIDFDRIFEIEKDILATIPEDEYKALAKKSIGTLCELLARGQFTNEGTYQEKEQRYEDRSNPLKKFVEQNLEWDGESHVWLYEVFDRLNVWLIQRNMRRVSKKELGMVLELADIEVKRLHTDTSSSSNKWNAVMGYKWREKVHHEPDQTGLRTFTNNQEGSIESSQNNEGVNTMSTMVTMVDNSYSDSHVCKTDSKSPTIATIVSTPIELSQTNTTGFIQMETEGHCGRCNAPTFRAFRDPYLEGHPIIYECSTC